MDEVGGKSHFKDEENTPRAAVSIGGGRDDVHARSQLVSW